MSHVCPLCNGIINPEFRCPNCLNLTTNSGKPEDYVGPYAPYEPNDSPSSTVLISGGSVQLQCLHIIYCEYCGSSTYVNGMAWA